MSKPVITCCEPVQRTWASNWQWYHARDCAVASAQRVLRSPDRREAEHRATVHRIEDARANVPTAAHPAGKNWGHAVTTWLKHQPGCDCWECQYIEAHLDDVVR